MNAAVRILRGAAIALGVHGVLLLVSVGLQQLLPDVFAGAAGMVVLWVLDMPALLLTQPFMPLLWWLGLVQATGWFAWPKPLGLALVYAGWMALAWALAWFVQSRLRHAQAHAGSG